jgi:hypothetical protein
MSEQILNRSSQRMIYWLGGVISFIFVAYSICTIMIMTILGTPPENIEQLYSMLNDNKLLGLLRLDILTVFIIPFYYLFFYSVYFALKDADQGLLKLSLILVFIGFTLFLASPSVFSYLHLSNKYFLASSAEEKNQLLAAGESIMASDIWHGTPAITGGIMAETGALLISLIMLKSNVFSKLTAYTGIVTYGLDLAHIIVGLFIPSVGFILMAIAGPLYLLWFPLIGLRLFKLWVMDKKQVHLTTELEILVNMAEI